VPPAYVWKSRSGTIRTWDSRISSYTHKTTETHKGSQLQETSELKLGSVVIDCINFDKMLAFWQEALHYITKEPAKGGWVILRDPAGRNTNVSLNQVQPSEKLTGRNWLHFDLYTRDQKGEVERLLKLGATRHPQEYEPDNDFIVLEDPDGNLFCVVDTTK
jgi:catechol 2,3-dioxygenase-like lactoylglutathione lyase family enzyme